MCQNNSFCFLFTGEREDAPGPSGVNAVRNTSNTYRRLTREELDRQNLDNSACYAFLRKEGLMERLLGHKMLTGRVDSYVTLGYLPLDPGEQAFGRKSNFVSFYVFHSFTSHISYAIGNCFNFTPFAPNDGPLGFASPHRLFLFLM